MTTTARSDGWLDSARHMAVKLMAADPESRERVALEFHDELAAETGPLVIGAVTNQLLAAIDVLLTQVPADVRAGWLRHVRDAAERADFTRLMNGLMR